MSHVAQQRPLRDGPDVQDVDGSVSGVILIGADVRLARQAAARRRRRSALTPSGLRADLAR
jgi:hypothetical protein